jgi:hypothetical protein
MLAVVAVAVLALLVALEALVQPILITELLALQVLVDLVAYPKDLVLVEVAQGVGVEQQEHLRQPLVEPLETILLETHLSLGLSRGLAKVA